MAFANRDLIGPRFGLWLITVTGLLACAAIGVTLANNAVATVILLLTLTIVFAWVIAAKQRWWLLVPVSGVLGGYFWFGFKLYPHEVALAGSLIPLCLGRAVRARNPVSHKTPFPKVLYLLSIYLLAHWLGSNIYNKLDSGGGYGNVTRAYFNAYWVIIFLIAFWRFGSTKYIPTALFLCYVTAGARLVVGLVTYFTNAFAYIPVVNYVLPGSTHDRGADLRFSGLTMATLAACYFLIHRGFVRKSFHLLVFLVSTVALLFGSGRTVLVLLCLIPIFAAVLYRKVAPLFVTSFFVGLILITVNVAPTLLEPLPSRVQRSASILLFSSNEADKYGQAGSSDEWHANLRALGFKKWTSSWHNFLFGTGIRPYDNAISQTILGETTNEDYQESSAKVGAYESGWWTVIAVTGLTGIILYLTVLLYLLRRLVPILFREKVKDHAHAFAFMGVFGIVIWLGLGWTNGGFPSTEIMFGFLALLALEDRKEARRQSLAAEVESGVTQPPKILAAAGR
ncbi:MAG: hypothetical protein H0X40_07050 [Chthoniobacterales bacterium]|nr:hypothetical protein [Chthoniobacterales bacterium]